MKKRGWADIEKREDIEKEFLEAYRIISDIHRHRHKMMLLSRVEGVKVHLDYLNSIVSHMLKYPNNVPKETKRSSARNRTLNLTRLIDY